MNNKGQTLVFFILLLPIILICLSFIVDIGLLNSTKKSTDQKLEQIIENGLSNNITYEEWDKLVNNNFKNIQSKNILKKDNSIEITIKIKLEPIFPNIMLEDTYEVTYLGYIETEKINIVRK